jgi:uncharacterized protein (TIGR02284 family)
MAARQNSAISNGFKLTRRIHMDRTAVISTLNDLLRTTNDGEDGFRLCAEKAKEERLRAVFESAAAICVKGADELERTIRDLGGEAAQNGTASGLLHRAWTALKDSIAGMDDHAILVECERGEDAAKEVYEAALRKDLPPDVRIMVERQYRGLLASHQRIRELRDGMRIA